jgi:hypothetical protein
MYVLAQDLRCARNTPWGGGVTLPKDVAKKEANHAYNKWLQVPKQRQGCGWRTLPPSLNPKEGTTKRRMKTESKGR